MRSKQDPRHSRYAKKIAKNLYMSIFCCTFAAEMCTYVYACAMCASK